MQMFRVFLHNGSQHAIPIDDRTAEDLALQLSVLFAQGGSVLSMRVTQDPDPEEINTKSKARQKKSA